MTATAAGATVFCPRCGVRAERSYRFCGNCGAPLAGVAGATESAPSPELAVLRGARRRVAAGSSPREALYALGLAYARSGDWDLACDELERALANGDGAPSDHRIHEVLALATGEAGRPATDQVAHALLAYAGLDRANRADVGALVVSIAALPALDGLRPLGSSLSKLSDTGAGLACVVLALCGDSAEASDRARSLQARGSSIVRWSVQRSLAMVAERTPGAPTDDALLALGEVAAIVGARRLARRAAGLALDGGGQDDARIGRAHALLARVTDSAAQRSRHLFEAGRHMSWTDDQETAARYLREAIAAGAPNEAHWYLAESLRRQGSATEPFATDESALTECLRVLRDGFDRQAPAPEFAWAYNVAALTHAVLAEVEDDPTAVDAHLWEALRTTICGLALGSDPWDMYGWSTLPQRLRAVGGRELALAADRVALHLAGEPDSFEARFGAPPTPADDALLDSVAAAFLLDPAALEAAIARARTRGAAIGNVAWLDLVAGWAAMRGGAPAEAVERTRRVAESADATVDARFGYARALLLAGQRTEALAIADGLYRRLGRVAGGARGWLRWCSVWMWPALWIGRVTEAEEVARRVIALRPPGRGLRVDPLLLLMAAALQREARSEAEEHLEALLADDPAPGQLLDCADGLELTLGSGTDGEIVDRIARRLRSDGDRAAAGHDRSLDGALAELEQLRQRVPGGAASLSATAALLLAAEGRWSDAAARAQEMATEDAGPEAAALLSWAQDHRPVELLTALRGRSAEDARATIAAYAAAGPLGSGAHAAGVWREALTVADYWALIDLADTLPPGGERRYLRQAAARLDDWLERRFDVPVQPDPAASAAPAPLVVELSEALMPQDFRHDWKSSALVADLIPALRTEIEVDWGIVMPGITFRDNAALADGEYVIFVSEAPADGGTLPLGHRWCERRAEGTPARHPETWRRGAWLPDAPDTASGLDPIAFIVAHLGAIVRAHLPCFVLTDDVAALARKWCDEGAPTAFAELVGQPDRLAWLTALMRALIADGVPLGDRSAVIELILAHRTAPLPDATRAIRWALRHALPGNQPGTEHMTLGAEFCDAVRVAADGTLSAAPRTLWGLTISLLVWREQSEGPVAVVVEDYRLAHALRQLITDEVPAVGVIAREELVDV